MDFVAWVITCNVKEQTRAWSPPVRATQQPQLWVPFHRCEGAEPLVCWETGQFWICLSEYDWEVSVSDVQGPAVLCYLAQSETEVFTTPSPCCGPRSRPCSEPSVADNLGKRYTSAATQLWVSKVGSLCSRCSALLEMRFSTCSTSLQTALNEKSRVSSQKPIFDLRPLWPIGS